MLELPGNGVVALACSDCQTGPVRNGVAVMAVANETRLLKQPRYYVES